jgi:tRNA threonylcarbamoyladenosine biosynthesis protein TsaB
MPTFLIIHTRYNYVHIGLYNNQTLLDSIEEENKRISKNFLLLIQELLQKYNLNIYNLDFIAAHQGPAPFTTLRVVLASVNGLAFATQVPLIGVDGLNAFTHDYKHDKCNTTIALLNAFCDDIYYGILNHETKSFHKGYAHSQRFLQEMSDIITDNILFIGNGSDMHINLIKECFKSRAYFIEPNPEMVDLSSVAQAALELYKNKNNIVSQLMPLYLKEHAA